MPELQGEVQQVFNDFHDKYKEAPIEHAYLVDTETGQICQHARGVEGEVSINSSTIPDGRQAIIIHNHPTQATPNTVSFDPLSKDDIAALLDDRKYSHIIATNQHRTHIAEYPEVMYNSFNLSVGQERISTEIKDMLSGLINGLKVDVENSRDIIRQNTNLTKNEIDEICKLSENKGKAKIMAEVDNTYTQRITKYLNDNGVKTWEIHHQSPTDRIRNYHEYKDMS